MAWTDKLSLGESGLALNDIEYHIKHNHDQYSRISVYGGIREKATVTSNFFIYQDGTGAQQTILCIIK